MTSKFILEVQIPNVTSLLEQVEKEPTGILTIFSKPVANQGLQWFAGIRVFKPKPFYLQLNANLSSYLYCRGPASKTWGCDATFKMMLENLNSEDNNEPVRFGKTKPLTFSSKCTGIKCGWPNFMTFEELLEIGCVKDNEALFRIEVYPGLRSGPHDAEKHALSITSVEDRMSRTLSLLHSGKGFNVTFVTKDGEQVKAHRDILMAGSPVFAAMLEETTEMTYPEVPLPDLTSTCLQTILEYIYGAPLSNLDPVPLSLLQELISAAHKYELNVLKEYCGQLLVERWNPSNLWQLYKTIRKYEFQGPRKELEEVMKEHFGEVLDQAVAASAVDDTNEDCWSFLGF